MLQSVMVPEKLTWGLLGYAYLQTLKAFVEKAFNWFFPYFNL